MTICRPGDHIIAASDLYGGTYSQFTNMYPNMGIQTTMIDGQNMEALKGAFKENTKAVYYETLGNPSFNVCDFEAVAAICQEMKVPFIVDNTFGMCGYTCRPMKFGVNIVTSSCTKWIGGHGTTIGGIIVDGNNFDWSVKMADGSPKFPNLAAPSPAYHGMNFQDVFGPTGPFGCNMAFIFHARVVALRDMGACPNPFGSFQLLMGLETLPMRCKVHCENGKYLKRRNEQCSCNYCWSYLYWCISSFIVFTVTIPFQQTQTVILTALKLILFLFYKLFFFHYNVQQINIVKILQPMLLLNI